MESPCAKEGGIAGSEQSSKAANRKKYPWFSSRFLPAHGKLGVSSRGKRSHTAVRESPPLVSWPNFAHSAFIMSLVPSCPLHPLWDCTQHFLPGLLQRPITHLPASGLPPSLSCNPSSWYHITLLFKVSRRFSPLREYMFESSSWPGNLHRLASPLSL